MAAVSRMPVSPTPKLPPHSVDAEVAVLGGLIVSNAAWYRVSALVAEEDFYTHDHRVIWRAIASMLKAGKAVDVVTIAEHMRDAGVDNQTIANAMQMAVDTPSAANIEAHANLVRQLSRRRALITLSQDIAEAAYSGEDAEEITARCSAGVENLLRTSASTSVRIDQMATDALTVFREAEVRRRRGESQGALTGLPALDFLTGGFHGPMLIVLAARPKCGKTALLNQFSIHSARKGHGGLIVSLEMGANQTAARALALAAKVSVSKIQRGEGDEIRKAEEAVSTLRDLPLWFDFETWNLDAILAQIAMHKHRYGITWAAVDHIGLVKCRERFNNRNDQIGHISWTLKQAAKRLNLPIIALSQLSRECDRENRKPRADDLRDSGNVEQDADMVVMLHVPMKERTQLRRKALIGITANRNGPSVWVPNEYEFIGSTQTFFEQPTEAGGDARYAAGNDEPEPEPRDFGSMFGQRDPLAP